MESCFCTTDQRDFVEKFGSFRSRYSFNRELILNRSKRAQTEMDGIFRLNLLTVRGYLPIAHLQLICIRLTSRSCKQSCIINRVKQSSLVAVTNSALHIILPSTTFPDNDYLSTLHKASTHLNTSVVRCRDDNSSNICY